MKIFITGITGFAGSFLAELLLSKGYEISGTYISDESLPNISSIRDSIHLEKVNLLDQEAVKSIIANSNPDGVFHLAALTSPSKSFSDPKEFFHNNIDAELHLLDAVRVVNSNIRVLVVSSSEIYGSVMPEDLPIDEDTPLRPGSPYAVSKIAQDFLADQYARSYQMNIVKIRPFNHIGPRQSPHFVVSAFAKQIAEIEANKKENKLVVGNLSSARDFTDVRDMVKAYSLLLEKGVSGEAYNIGTGKSHHISDILEKLLSLSTTQIDYEVDKALFRPTDTPNIYCDRRKISKATGWEPVIPIEQSLKDTLDYWRNIVYNN